MSRLSRLLVFALFCSGFPASAYAAQPPAEDGLWYSRQESGEVRVTLYFFWSLTCPHCARAQPFVRELAEANPWLRLQSLEVADSAFGRGGAQALPIVVSSRQRVACRKSAL